MSDTFGSYQNFTIVKAVVDAGKETIEIGEKILGQVHEELGDLMYFQQENDKCFSDLVKISKTMEGEQQNLTSKSFLINSWDKKQHFHLIAKLQDKLKGMKEVFEKEENEYFKTQEEVSNMKIQLNQKQQQLAIRKASIRKSPTPKITTRKPPALKPVTRSSVSPAPTSAIQTPTPRMSKTMFPSLSTPKLTKSILKPTTPKRKRHAPSQSPPPKKLPLKERDPDKVKTMETDNDNDADDSFNFWND
ncbi:unnamed protein product [Meloidogyne enterolobii]|uniref:Uncharacterized protein n=2 Tax=Meloidogyne enterolobii TaxID=390850 RepID=A0ACB0ZE05_MELEN